MIERRLPTAFIIRRINDSTEAKLVPYRDELLELSDSKPSEVIKCYDFSLDSCVMRPTTIAYCGWDTYKHFRVVDYVRYSETDFEVMLDEITWEQAKELSPSYTYGVVRV